MGRQQLCPPSSRLARGHPTSPANLIPLPHLGSSNPPPPPLLKKKREKGKEERKKGKSRTKKNPAHPPPVLKSHKPASPNRKHKHLTSSQTRHVQDCPEETHTPSVTDWGVSLCLHHSPSSWVFLWCPRTTKTQRSARGDICKHVGTMAQQFSGVCLGPCVAPSGLHSRLISWNRPWIYDALCPLCSDWRGYNHNILIMIIISFEGAI